MKHKIYGLLMVTMAFGCGRSESKRDNNPISPPIEFSLQRLTSEENRNWRKKIIERLWHRQSVSSEEKMNLLALESDAFLSAITDDPRFTETILDFNTYFLGFHSSSMRHPDGELDTVFNPNGAIDSYYSYTPAVLAAKEFEKGGDYFTLFALPEKIYLAPLRYEDFDPGQDPQDFVNERRESIAKMREHFKFFAEKADAGETLLKEDICEDGRLKHQPEIFQLGFPFHLLFTISSSRPDAKISDFEICKKPKEMSEEEYAKKELTESEFTELRKTHDYWEEKILKLVDELDSEKYVINSVSDIRELPIKNYLTEGQPLSVAQTNTWFFSTLVNSSTNMNRKRAAYVLKQYFCDDLTPVNVVVPSEHAEEAHGSSASCYSCHYKLDPMAGFFRNQGVRGSDFSQAEEIFFDDMAKVPRKDYVKNWQRNDGTWNIGYVRSPEDSSLNIYPEKTDLNGLFELIRNSDEPKRCLVEKAFQYFLGDKVAVDGEFRNLFAEKFLEESKENSVEAMKSLVKGIVKTNSFVVESPEKGQCYDLPPGVDPNHRPPCAINFIIQKNCVACHSTDSNLGGLDLTTWTPDNGFNHTDSSLSNVDILQRIEDRLTTSDKNIRMPLRKHIESTELQELVLWISEKKAQAPKGEMQ